jgi:hypothetical protein
MEEFEVGDLVWAIEVQGDLKTKFVYEVSKIDTRPGKEKILRLTGFSAEKGWYGRRFMNLRTTLSGEEYKSLIEWYFEGKEGVVK